MLRLAQRARRLHTLPVPNPTATATALVRACAPFASDLDKTSASVSELFQSHQLDNLSTDTTRRDALATANAWFAFAVHPKQPKPLLKKPPPSHVLTAFQISRAAGIITNVLNFKALVDGDNLPVEFTDDKQKLCMDQYRHMFSASRVPGSPKDSLVSAHPSTFKHILVMVRDQIYKVSVLLDDGSRVPIKEIERQLFAVAQDSAESTNEPAIGIFTAGDRDTWASVYSTLNGLSEENKANFRTINNALFAICLDDFSSYHNINASHVQMFHNKRGNNRWFDKTLSFIIASNGQAGLNSEVSPVDPQITAKLASYVVSLEPAVDPTNVQANSRLPSPTKLKWSINDDITTQLNQASEDAKKLSDTIDSCILETDLYGSRYMAEVAKTDPDAFIQMVLQLTYYRLHQSHTAVRHTASMRTFKSGRTEIARSLTTESRDFVESFDNDNILYDDKRSLFAKAIAMQSQIMNQAMQGQGIDRHLSALSKALSSSDAKPALFSDPVFLRSMHFKLATCNIPVGESMYSGFAPLVADGYGVCYSIGKDSIRLSISANKDQETNAFKFRSTFERTLRDMFILFPKRTQVWGYGWQKKHDDEEKHAYMLKQMKKLSDIYRSKQAVITERYRKDAEADKVV